jgi:hypothetical protein
LSCLTASCSRRVSIDSCYHTIGIFQVFDIYTIMWNLKSAICNHQMRR